MNKRPSAGVGTDPVAYTVSGDGKYVVPLTVMTLFIMFGMFALTFGAAISAWIFYAILGDWGIILWKSTMFVTVFGYFLVVRPYRKAKNG